MPLSSHLLHVASVLLCIFLVVDAAPVPTGPSSLRISAQPASRVPRGTPDHPVAGHSVQPIHPNPIPDKTQATANASNPPKKSKGKLIRTSPPNQAGPSNSGGGAGPSSSDIKPGALEFAQWIANNPADVNEKSVCFYSGRSGAGDHSASVMPKFATATQPGNCNWMSTLRGKFNKAQARARKDQSKGRKKDEKQKDQSKGKQPEDKWGNAEWVHISGTLAKTVAGHQVRVLLGATVSPNSVWEMVEKQSIQDGLTTGRVPSVACYSWTGTGAQTVFSGPVPCRGMSV